MKVTEMDGDRFLTRLPRPRRLLGSILGGVVAGLVLAVWLVVGEVVSRQPSQLTVMERQVAGWVGGTTALNSPIITTGEEYAGLAGHLLLSAIAGAAYALIFRRDRSLLLNGLLFGAVFFVAAHAVVGPLLGLTPGMWKYPPSVLLTGFIINGFFGLCTAFFAYQFAPAHRGSATDQEHDQLTQRHEPNSSAS